MLSQGWLWILNLKILKDARLALQFKMLGTTKRAIKESETLKMKFFSLLKTVQAEIEREMKTSDRKGRYKLQ